MAIKKSTDAVDESAIDSKTLNFYLVVASAFDDYRRGDIITDVDEIEKILASDRVNFVHKIFINVPKV